MRFDIIIKERVNIFLLALFLHHKLNRNVIKTNILGITSDYRVEIPLGKNKMMNFLQLRHKRGNAFLTNELN